MKKRVINKDISRTERTKSEISKVKLGMKTKSKKVNKKNLEKGFVYIMKNVSMEGILKIGTSENAVLRAKKLRTTGVPTPFEILYSKEVKRPYEIETIIHKFLYSSRVDPKREFFRDVVLEDIIRLIEKDILPIFGHFNGGFISGGSTMMVIDDDDDDDEVEDEDDNESSS